MKCSERIRDLLPDYYLGHLSPEESEEVRAHLAEHAACRDALADVAHVLDLMPFTIQRSEPPSELKERVMLRVLSEGREAEAETTTPGLSTDPGLSEPVSVRRSLDLGRRSLLPLMAAAAVVLVAFIGLPWMYVDLQRDNQRLQAEIQELQESVQPQGGLLAVAAEGTGRAPDAQGTAVVDPGTGALALDVYNMPTPPTDHAYQAWLVSPAGDTLSLGRMEISGQGYGQMTGEVSEPLAQYDSLQLTMEPLGAESMSGPVYLEARL